MKYRYSRKSTEEQTFDRIQTQEQFDDLFYDSCSGMVSFKERKEATRLMSVIQSGDELSVPSLDRLGRNIYDVQKTINELVEMGIQLYLEDLKLSSHDIDGNPSPVFPIVTSVLSMAADIERKSLLLRTKAGREAFRAKNPEKGWGRPKGTNMSNRSLLERHKNIVKWLTDYSHMSYSDIAKVSGKSRQTVSKVAKLLEV